MHFGFFRSSSGSHRLQQLPVKASPFQALTSASLASPTCSLCAAFAVALTFESCRIAKTGQFAAASTGEADFHLLTSTQSVDRGTRLVDGAMVVDVLQAAIDVDRNAARGREQSDYIFHDVLGWRNV